MIFLILFYIVIIIGVLTPFFMYIYFKGELKYVRCEYCNNPITMRDSGDDFICDKCGEKSSLADVVDNLLNET